MQMRNFHVLAGSARVVFGLLGLAVLPSFLPPFAAHRWFFLAYTAYGAAMLVLIYKEVGPTDQRVFWTGLVDLIAVTFVVQRVGSVQTGLPFLYLVVVTMTALTAGFRVGVGHAAIGALLYVGVLAAEANGWLPYAPEGLPWAKQNPPQADARWATGAGFVIGLLAAAALVGQLATIVRRREEELIRTNTRLEDLSQRDPLTHLSNRRHFLERLEVELARVRRGHPLTVLMIDLDRFKDVNDQYGHHRGDRLLQDVALALQMGTREVDLVGRYGGDEFAVLLSDTDTEAGMQTAERLVARIRQRAAGEVDRASVTASVGAVGATYDDDADTVMHRADATAYRAKQDGGDRVVLASTPAPGAP